MDNNKIKITEKDKEELKAHLNTINEFLKFFRSDIMGSAFNKDDLYETLNENEKGIKELNKVETAFNSLCNLVGEPYFVKR